MAASHHARLVDLSHERSIQPTILFDAALHAGRDIADDLRREAARLAADDARPRPFCRSIARPFTRFTKQWVYRCYRFHTTFGGSRHNRDV
jgi:hypothetical protein